MRAFADHPTYPSTHPLTVILPTTYPSTAHTPIPLLICRALRIPQIIKHVLSRSNAASHPSQHYGTTAQARPGRILLGGQVRNLELGNRVLAL